MVRKALDLFAATAADSGWRICVLDSAEDLNANAANALLKVLEEPPPRALFLISRTSRVGSCRRSAPAAGR